MGVRARTGGDGQRGASGLARCVRTREVGVRMIQAAHEAGWAGVDALVVSADNEMTA